jgi:DNA-binding IclR family transcriptional regulator
MNSEGTLSKPDLYVLARVIKTLKEKGRQNKTTLATVTGLSYDKLIKYLNWMTTKVFIQYDANDEWYLLKPVPKPTTNWSRDTGTHW